MDSEGWDNNDFFPSFKDYVDNSKGKSLYEEDLEKLKEWRENNPELKGNIRDYATVNELICLSNMENLNAVFIEQNIPQGERLIKLNQIAIHQMNILESGDNGERKLLK